jgi:hypothetical protein
MLALHVAWVWGGAMYIRWTRQMRLRRTVTPDASSFKRNFAVGALGKWRTTADGLLRATRSIYRVMWDAACETMYDGYRGGGYAMLTVAQFLVASQALQGVAQAAGELVDDARTSCIVAACAQLTTMALCAAVLQWTQPHRVRRNYYAEFIPAAIQVGLCASSVVLAARRWTVNASIAAGLGAAVEFTCMLQPLLSVATVLFDAVA